MNELDVSLTKLAYVTNVIKEIDSQTKFQKIAAEIVCCSNYGLN